MPGHQNIFSVYVRSFLPRPYLPEFGSHAFLLNFLVSGPYIVCSLVAGYSDDITQV